MSRGVRYTEADLCEWLRLIRRATPDDMSRHRQRFTSARRLDALSRDQELRVRHALDERSTALIAVLTPALNPDLE